MASAQFTTAGLFVVLAAIWGGSFVAARAALSDITPVFLAAFRFDIAAVLMLCYAAVTTRRWLPDTRRAWTAVIVGGCLFVAVHHALLFAGQRYVTSAVAAVVVCLDPILAAAFGRVLLPEERLSPIGGLGLLFGVLGVAVVADLSPAALFGANVLGIVLVGLSAAAFAFGAVMLERLRTDLPVQSLQAWMMVVGAPLLHGVAWLLPGEEVATLTWSWPALVGLGYLAVVAAGFGYLLYFELLDRVGAIEINLVAYATPIFAAGGGWLVLGEQFHIRTLLGLGSIAVGFALIKREALKTMLRDFRT